jgi:microcystin-dependent protein
MAFWQWSRTSSSNGNSDPTVNFLEGQAPSSLNDSSRAAMARLREWGDDIAGAIVTGGTSTAFTVTSFQGFDSYPHANGKVIAFSPHATNGAGPVTLSLDGLGAKPLRSAPSTELLAGTLILGTPYTCLYNDSDGAFYLSGFFGNAYNIPLGGGMDYWLPTAPNSSFVFPIGQAISRTTYATLFAAMGTTYGVGDGSTTFNVPDKTGRISAMKEASATRLTSTYFGGNSTTLGAVGGLESDTLAMANLPASPAPVAAQTNSWQPTINNGANSAVSTGVGATPQAVTLTGGGSVYPSTAFAIMDAMPARTVSNNTANLGSGTPIRTVQPTIVCNYILRII